MSRIRIAVVKEVTYGVLPTNPAFKTLRLTSEDLTATPDVVSSNEIRSDRMSPDTIVVGETNGGTVNIEFSALHFDDFVAAAFCNDWATDVLTTGTDDVSFAVLKSYLDLDKHILFLGQRVGAMDLQFTFKQILTGSITFTGASKVIYQDQTALNVVLGTGSVTEDTAKDILNASDDITKLEIDGSASDVCFRSLQIAWNNGMRPKECLASKAPKDQIKGDSDVSGAVELFFANESWALLEDSFEQTAFGLGIEASDSAGNKYFFEMPRSKINAPAPSVSGRNQDLLLSGSYRATYDSVAGYDIRCTRVQIP